MTNPQAIDTNLHRIRRYSVGLAFIALFFAIAWPITVAIWIMLSPAELISGKAGVVWRPISASADLMAWQRASLLLLGLCPVLLGSKALLSLRSCFRLFARGEFFARQTISALRSFAGFTCLSVLIGILSASLSSVVVSWEFGPGLKTLNIGIGSPQLVTLFFAGTVWLIAAVMTEAQVLAEENAQFI